MYISDIKIEFQNRLNHLYPKDEIVSFFYLTTQQILGKDRIEIALNPSLEISELEAEEFMKVISELELERPIQYILGETEFCGLPFTLTNDVLIPRPETEELVDRILKEFSDKRDLKILDIGTGSGCIAISLAKHMPNSKVYGLDVSKSVLKVAMKNAEINQVELTFISCNALDPSSWRPALKDIQFDIIVSNPPYVRYAEKEEIKANVLNYEPHSALFVKDDDPLIFYKNIKEIALQKLRPKGKLYLEINQYLGVETRAVFENIHFEDVRLIKDLNDNDRFVIAQRKHFEHG